MGRVRQEQVDPGVELVLALFRFGQLGADEFQLLFQAVPLFVEAGGFHGAVVEGALQLRLELGNLFRLGLSFFFEIVELLLPLGPLFNRRQAARALVVAVGQKLFVL